MSIAKRSNGAYTVQIDGERVNGRRKKITVGTFDTKREADRAERDALQNRDRGIDLNPERIDVATLLDRYMQDKTERGRGAKTVERYGELAALYLKPHIGGIAVAKLKPAHVTELLTLLRKRGGAKGRPLSPGSVRHAFVLLNGALGWAMRNELVSRNVAKAIEAPSIPRTTAVALSDGEARVILVAAEKTRWGPFMRLAIICGARRGELVGLRWGDIDFTAGTVTVACSLSQTRAHGVREKSTKTDRVRTIDDLSPEALEALRRQRVAQNAERLAAGERYRDSGHVFQEPLGGSIAPDKATGAFRRLARRNGVPTTSLHALRHTAGSWLIADGTDPRTAAHMLGHASPSTTMAIYAHVMPGKQKAAMLRQDERLAALQSADVPEGIPKGYRRPTSSRKTLIP